MHRLLIFLLLTGCRLTPDGGNAASENADALAASGADSTVIAVPRLDVEGVDPYGRPLPLGAFDAMVASVDTTTASGVGLLAGSGVYHDGEAPAADGQTWQALVPTSDGFGLRSVTVRVETVRDEIVDPEAGPFTGRRVTTPLSTVHGDGWVEDSTVALVRRPAAPFPEGLVPTAFEGLWPFEGGALHLTLGEARYEVTYATGPEASPGFRPERVVLLARDGGPKRPVAHLVNRDDAHPALLWAGDLDGDGRLDLLLDESWHYNLSAPTLYLSSAASGDAPVGRVARHETTGC